MKTKLLSILTVTLVFAAGSAYGQTLKADIPFNFNVGKKVFPAGIYYVIPGNHGQTLTLRNVETRGEALVGNTLVDRNRPAEKSELVFNKYGNVYFLSRVFAKGETVAYAMQATRSEVEMAGARPPLDVDVVAQSH